MTVNENKLRIYFVVAMLLASQGVALAGPPRTFEQLDVFGKSSASFPRSIVDPRWSPGSDWNNSTDLNNFAPSRWQTGTVDRNWYPKDG